MIEDTRRVMHAERRGRRSRKVRIERETPAGAEPRGCAADLLACRARHTQCVGGVRSSPPGGQVGDRRARRPGEWLVPAARSRLGSWISDESSLSRIKHAGAADSPSLSP